jgi:hypothetical protein
MKKELLAGSPSPVGDNMRPANNRIVRVNAKKGPLEFQEK